MGETITNSKSREEFIRKAKLIHDDLYNYDELEYINVKTKGKIFCQTHGIFEQRLNSHLEERGCRLCADDTNSINYRLDKKEFIEKARLIHGDLYNYDLFEYINARVKGKIICKEHGIFEQTPDNHAHDHGCPRCTHVISKSETKWLDSLNITLRNHSIKSIKRKINVDGYDPETNTVYQFHGDYWHGNPIKYSPHYWNKKLKKLACELYEETIKTDKLIIESGYNLITIWESDFKDITNE